MHQLDRAEAELERQYGVPSHRIVHGDEPEHVPPDVLTWWRAADARRRELIAARPVQVHVTDGVEPMERRKDRLRKPPSTR